MSLLFHFPRALQAEVQFRRSAAHVLARQCCRVCCASVVSLGADVSLIVAGLDLKLVRLLRGAMAGQLSAFGLNGVGAGPLGTRHIEPRPRVEPEPRFEPRKVIHPQPGIEPGPCHPAPCQAPHEAELPLRTRSPLEPPWRVVPWKPSAPPAQPLPKVKLLIARPDVVTKGTLIDFFI